MQLPPTVAARLAQGDLSTARDAVRAAFSTGVPSADRRAWAAAAEAVGSSLLALQAWQAVLAAEPEAADALRRLAELHADRGDGARAQACRTRLAQLTGEQAAPTEPDRPGDEPPPPPLGEPGTGDLVRFAMLFGGREGVHARQWADRDKTGYSPVQGTLTPELCATHLRGDVTLGAYLVRRDDRALQLVFDLDATKAALERAVGHPDRAKDLRRRIHDAGLALLAGVRATGLDPLLVDSGYKGRHLWCLLPEPEPAGLVRAFGEAWARVLAPADPELCVEVFPRQDRVAPGHLGNLVKLPLGIHLKTGRRCVLLDDTGQPVLDPWERLRAVRRVALADARRAPPVLLRTGAPLPWDGPGPEADEEATPRDPVSAVLPAAPAPPPFSEGDFEARPRLAAILAGCALLRAVVDGALRENRLDLDARVALEHSLGHLPEGVEAVNYLLRRAGSAQGTLMGAPHSGSPSSCRNLRRRLAGAVAPEECRCVFEAVGDSYPHPGLHALGVAVRVPAPEAPPLEQIVEALARVEARLGTLERERDDLRRQVLARLAGLPSGSITLGDSTWRAEQVEGIPVLVRERAAGG